MAESSPSTAVSETAVSETTVPSEVSPERTEPPTATPSQGGANAVDLAVIGFSEFLEPPTREARRLNAAGMKAHRSGDFATSAQRFEQALAVSPDYALAEFNAACAHSRLGRIDQALTSMRELLRTDLAQFRARWLEDPDLEAARLSAAGIALTDELPALDAAYDDALQHGVFAFLYRPVAVKPDSAASFHPLPHTPLRIGVYDGRTRRFVALVPPVARAYSGLIDRDSRRAVVAEGWLQMKDMWEVQPHGATATLFALDPVGEALFTAQRASSRYLSYGFELWLGPDDSLYGAHYGVHYTEQVDYFHWTNEDPRHLGSTNAGDSQPPPAQVPFDEASLHVVELAEVVAPKHPFATFERGVIRDELHQRRIKLERGHHAAASIIPSHDPDTFVVISNATRFTWDGAEEPDAFTRDRHVIDLVDAKTGTATRLAKGPGYAHVAWAPDGTLFVETPSETWWMIAGSVERHRDVMHGVHFGTPPHPESGGV